MTIKRELTKKKGVKTPVRSQLSAVSQKVLAKGALSVKPPPPALLKKAANIQKILDRLFPEVEVPLTHTDPFTLLIAVVLSARTTDKKVNEITPKLFARANTPLAMSKLAVPEILNLIKEVGLAPRKAAALQGLSEIIVKKHGGKVPASFAELEALPGVGHKTASVVMAHAFHVPAFPVDTHIYRLAKRWGLSRGASVEEVERDLKALFLEKDWNKVHLQIIYCGRTYCKARFHEREACPICGPYGEVMGK